MASFEGLPFEFFIAEGLQLGRCLSLILFNVYRLHMLMEWKKKRVGVGALLKSCSYFMHC